MTLDRSKVLTALQVRPAEARRALSLAALMALTSAGGAISSPAAEALFYARFGVEFLPYMYMALGLVTALTSLLITGLLGRIPNRALYRWFPLVMAGVLLGARALIAADRSWLYPALWLLVYLTWTLQFFMIWGLAGSVFDTRQAKRLFPLFAAGGILGTAAGGLMTRPLVTLVGSENLLLAWPIAFVGAFWLVGRLRAAVRGVPARRTRRTLLEDLQRGYRLVGRSQLLRWMSWSALLLGLLLFAVIFPFSKGVAQTFPDENRMAGFLGAVVGASTAVAFLLSLLLTNRLFARLGFMGGLVGFPLIYLVGFATLAVWPAFAAIAALRFLQLVWRLGVADTAFQAVFNILPSDRREPARAFIDGVPRQAGVVMAGFLLLLSERTLQPAHTYLLGVAISALCLAVLWRARSAYRSALAEALRAGRPQVFFSEEEPFGGFRSDAAAVATAVEGVSDPDPVVRRVAAEILGNLRLPEATQALVGALDDPDPGVRASLLRALAKAEATSALLDVAGRLQDPEVEVRLQAVQALRDLAGYPAGLRTLLEGLLEDPSPQVRGCTAVVMLQTGEHPRALQVLRSMQDAADPQTRIVALEAVTDWKDPAGFEFAANSLDDPHRAVRRAAAAALASFQEPEGIGLLVVALADEEPAVREAAASGLSAYGAPAVQATLGALHDPASEAGALLALRHLPLGQQAPELYRYAVEKRRRAVDYLEVWDGLGRTPQLEERMELLSSSVQSAADRQARQAIEAMGVLHDPDAALLALENLASEDRDQRANALEVIESLGGRGFSAPLLGLWEPSAADGGSVPDPLRWLEHALHDPDAWIRACAALAAAGRPALGPQLQELARADPDPLVRQTAGFAVNGGPNMESLPTLSIMERILFLRRVPLFSDLPPSELKQIAAIANELVFEDEAVIAEQGEPGDEMFIIAQGEVQVITRHESGAAEQLAHRGSGEVVGEMAIISHEPRMASLVAKGEVRMLCIGQKEFEGILRERPETSLAVMRELIERLKEAQGGEAH